MTESDSGHTQTMEWFYRQPNYYGDFTSLEELLRYVDAETAEIDKPALRSYLTPRCTECGMRVGGMTTEEALRHIIVKGNVIVACEWYWVVDPNAVGIQDTWCDWAEEMTPEDKARWIETGRITA